MKYYIAASILLAAFVLVITQTKRSPETVAMLAHEEWRRNAVEPETKVRPAYFEAMKWSPKDSVEMRAPASNKKKNK